MKLWQTDWEKFVEAVAQRFSESMDDVHLTNEFAGNKVVWSGSIRNIELGQEDSNGIAMDMPDVKIRLLDGRLLVANYIFLLVEPSKQEAWDKFSAGETVTFATFIRESNSIFPEVQVSINSNNPESILMLGTENALPVS
ncbi:MAG: hypothetical protein AAF304_01815 [Pseudomonadota bacterium]